MIYFSPVTGSILLSVYLNPRGGPQIIFFDVFLGAEHFTDECRPPHVNHTVHIKDEITEEIELEKHVLVYIS